MSQMGRPYKNLSLETGPFARKRVGIIADYVQVRRESQARHEIFGREGEN
jgi:hypothetical protein